MQDFANFFSSQPSSVMNAMVFWSGTGQPDSVTFANAKSRNSLEILIGDKWERFQKDKSLSSEAYWNTWDDAVAGFWDLASQACAEASTGIVYVYITPDRDADQRNQFTPDMSRPQCMTCWFRKEKPALINNR